MQSTPTHTIVNTDTIQKVRYRLPENQVLYELADFFKIFGDSTRIKILFALFAAEMCVNELTTVLEMTQSAVSHQLRILKQYGLVRYRKVGKYIYYSLKDSHIKKILDQGWEHIHEKI